MGNSSTRPWRILMLYSNTGGGHRASAEALRQEFLRRDPATRIAMEDVLLHRSIWPLTESDRFYFWAVNNIPWVWKLIYQSVAQPIVYSSIHHSLRPVLAPKLRRMYAATRPDIVISLHPLLNHLPRRILRQWEKQRGGRTIPFATVMTDLTTFHPAWVDPHADLLTVGTEDARLAAIRLGMPPSKVKLVGVPVREAFGRPAPDKRTLKTQLGLAPDRPVILLMSGGQGMGPVERIAGAIDRAALRAHLVIIAGRNSALKERLERKQWRLPTRVLGFVEDVHLWMKASDVLVTKAGPGTIAEALICGLPLILYGYIPGQEEGNVAFVTDRQIGVYLERPEAIAQRLDMWLQHPQRYLEPMSTRARALSHPRSTAAIADALIELMKARLDVPALTEKHARTHALWDRRMGS